jgi:choline kinase
MKAQLARDHSRVTAFGKHLPLDSTGVSIGAEKIAAADAPLIFEALEQMIHVDGRTDGYYEDAYDDALRRGLRMGAVSTQGDFWTEIDTPEELEAARVACQAAQAGVPSP